MKKQVLATLVCATILGGNLVGASNVFAADGGVYNTKGIVSFEEDTGITPPVDPEDPEKPVNPIDPWDPEKPVDPGTPGPLSIDFASSLDFGKQKIVTTDQTYKAATQKIETENGIEDRENYVQVTDKRGEAKGWGLSVKQEKQFETADGDVLNGAKITFKNAQLETKMESPKPSTLVEEFDLTSSGNGERIDVLAAAEGEGFGTWIYRFGDSASKGDSVTLEVPGKSVKKADKDYSTKIIWTLTDIPGNEGGGEGEDEDTTK